MAYQRRGEFAAAMAEIRERLRRPDDEIKWNKCSRSNVRFYRELIDYFFQTHTLFFHCIVVERAWVNLDLHNGSFDLARRKHFTQFLVNKIAAVKKAYPRREVSARVYVDRIPSSYDKAAETVGIVGAHMIKLALAPLAEDVKKTEPIEAVIECDSGDVIGIQLCDLLLGAVLDSWNNFSKSDHKAGLKCHVANYVGWPDLKSDTQPYERKFNVWMLTDKPQLRKVKTREIALKYPLPPVRRYKR